jgi:hypothetical protein
MATGRVHEPGYHHAVRAEPRVPRCHTTTAARHHCWAPGPGSAWGLASVKDRLGDQREGE